MGYYVAYTGTVSTSKFSSVLNIPHLQSQRIEHEFDAAAGMGRESPRTSHDSVYMRPNLVRQNTHTELNKQLSELQRTVAAQGELLKQILDELGSTSRPDSRTSARQNDIGMALNRNRS